MSERGRFIVFEGPDGSGKTTALKAVAERLREEGLEVVVTREPGGTPFAEKVRELVLLPCEGANERAAETDMLLVYAARSQHLEQQIIPALERGAVVLCDRFSASTYAYQVGAGRGDASRFWTLDEGFVWRQPDAYLYLTAPMATRIGRMRDRAGGDDRFDDVAEVIAEPLEKAYEAFMAEAPLREAYQETRFARINSDQALGEVREDCINVIKEL